MAPPHLYSCVCAHMSIGRPEVNTRCLHVSLSTSRLEAGSLNSERGWLAPGIRLSSRPHRFAATPGFLRGYMGSRDPNSVLMLLWQASSLRGTCTANPLSLLPFSASLGRITRCIPTGAACPETGLSGFRRQTDPRIQVVSTGEVYWQKSLKDTKDSPRVPKESTADLRTAAHFALSIGKFPRLHTCVSFPLEKAGPINLCPKQVSLLPTHFLKIYFV